MADQAAVDAALAGLNTAMDNLVPAGTAAIDRAALDAAITLALQRVEADYTAASWTPFAAALATAQGTLTTQAAVDAAAAGLNTAMSNLVPIDGNGGNGDNGGNGCGSGSVSLGLIVTLAAAFGAVLFVKKRS